jgi:hypothetical protein
MKYAGVPVTPSRRACRMSRCHRRAPLQRLEVRVQPVHVEPDLAGVRVELVHVEPALTKQQVVELPELALLLRRLGRQRRDHRLAVEVERERLVRDLTFAPYSCSTCWIVRCPRSSTGTRSPRTPRSSPAPSPGRAPARRPARTWKRSNGTPPGSCEPSLMSKAGSRCASSDTPAAPSGTSGAGADFLQPTAHEPRHCTPHRPRRAAAPGCECPCPPGPGRRAGTKLRDF